jgi:hypothetical protein
VHVAKDEHVLRLRHHRLGVARVVPVRYQTLSLVFPHEFKL